MAKKVKCRFCGQQIDINKAFKVKHGKANWYYCSYEHSVTKTDKQLFYKEVYEILGETNNPLFFKNMESLAKIYGFKKMRMYLIDKKEVFEIFKRKQFDSYYGKINYFYAILKNNLGDYIMPKESVKRKASTEIYETKNKKPNLIVGFDELLDGLLEHD